MPRDTLGGGDVVGGGGSGEGLPAGGPGVLSRAEENGTATWEEAPASVPTDSSVTNAKVANNAAIAESKLNLASDASAATASRRTLGTGAQQAAAGNDARLSDTRTPTNASVTVAKLDSTAKAALKAVCVHDGDDYPTRPSGFASVEWIGPDDPGVAAQDGDTWVPTA